MVIAYIHEMLSVFVYGNHSIYLTLTLSVYGKRCFVYLRSLYVFWT